MTSVLVDRVAARVPVALRADVVEVARASGLSESDVVRLALAQALREGLRLPAAMSRSGSLAVDEMGGR